MTIIEKVWPDARPVSVKECICFDANYWREVNREKCPAYRRKQGTKIVCGMHEGFIELPGWVCQYAGRLRGMLS